MEESKRPVWKIFGMEPPLEALVLNRAGMRLLNVIAHFDLCLNMHAQVVIVQEKRLVSKFCGIKCPPF